VGRIEHSISIRRRSHAVLAVPEAVTRLAFRIRGRLRIEQMMQDYRCNEMRVCAESFVMEALTCLASIERKAFQVKRVALS
jgi:hypothetical protein